VSILIAWMIFEEIHGTFQVSSASQGEKFAPGNFYHESYSTSLYPFKVTSSRLLKDKRRLTDLVFRALKIDTIEILYLHGPMRNERSLRRGAL
jgi:hypothetical protein